ncbi:MAG: hypothetical protein H0T68_02520 [Gemmatimonadales bacterium]|nr:hypothetical protein [Gemmatimonadales bacterium]
MGARIVHETRHPSSTAPSLAHSEHTILTEDVALYGAAAVAARTLRE